MAMMMTMPVVMIRWGRGPMVMLMSMIMWVFMTVMGMMMMRVPFPLEMDIKFGPGNILPLHPFRVQMVSFHRQLGQLLLQKLKINSQVN